MELGLLFCFLVSLVLSRMRARVLSLERLPNHRCLEACLIPWSRGTYDASTSAFKTFPDCQMVRREQTQKTGRLLIRRVTMIYISASVFIPLNLPVILPCAYVCMLVTRTSY
jgi:hypothetical protein